MQFINYISIIAVPFIIFIIILYGVLEKKKVFDIFIENSAPEEIKYINHTHI